MTEPNQPDDLSGEFRALAQNLKTALSTAWESEERKQLQSDIQSGLNELGQALDEAATEFRASETGQKLETDLNDLGEKVRSGEVEDNLRQGLLSALQAINVHIQKATDSWSLSETPEDAPQE